MLEKKLDIKQFKDGEILTCALSGWLDPNTSPQFLEQVNISGVKKIVVDLKGIEYVFSAGLRAFLILQKKMDEQDGTLRIVNVPPSIRSIFEYAGFESMID